MKIINLEYKEMTTLTNEEFKSNLNQRNCHICKRTFEYDYINNKNLS